jgi:hypothetical protein
MYGRATPSRHEDVISQDQIGAGDYTRLRAPSKSYRVLDEPLD